MGLISGQLANQSYGFLTLFKSYRISSKQYKWCWRSCAKMASTHRRLPLISTWSSLASKTGSQLPALLFAALFNPAVAGFYALAMRVVATPSSIIGGSIQKVFLSKAAKAYRDEQLPNLFRNAFEKSISLVAPLVVLFSLALPNIFLTIFGEEWRLSLIHISEPTRPY